MGHGTLEWWRLGCVHCGHWKVGYLTKQEIADWCRVHVAPSMRKQEPLGDPRESICPRPCGTP